MQTGAVLLTITPLNGIDLQQKTPNQRKRFLLFVLYAISGK